MTVKLPPATRLATLLALSGCLHLAGLALLARPQHVEMQTSPATSPLAVRLLPAPSRPQSPAPAPPSAARSTALPAPAQPVRSAAADPLTTTAPPAPVSQANDALAGTDDYVAYPRGLPAPPAYTMGWPVASTLTYEVTVPAAATPPVMGQASLSVAYGAEGYQVRLTGGVGLSQEWDAAHSASSEGARLDDGFAPLRASTARGGITETGMRLNRAHDPQAVPDGRDRSGDVIVHDRASMLLQLIGMGVQDSAQLQSTVELAVAGTNGAGLARFEFVAVERITVPFGTFDAWHLTQTEGPDASRLQVWLAPDLGWYPLQLTTTAPNGAVFVQRLLRADQAPAQPAP